MNGTAFQGRLKDLVRGASILLCILFSGTPRAEGVVIFGDSISVSEDSWPSYLVGHHLSLQAQGGRTIRDFELSRDLRAAIPFTTAVYFLGANDAAQGYPTYFAHRQFKNHMNLLESRNFNLIVVIPPVFTNSPYPEENFTKLRQEMSMLCAYLELNCYDSMEVWDNGLVEEDGIHPLPELSRRLAYWLQPIIDMEESQ